MKFLAFVILSVVCLNSTPLVAQQPAQCACKDCKCDAQSHCGCYSDQGCHCSHQNGNSTCSRRPPSA